MQRKFNPGDECEIVELGQGGFHSEARENFTGKKVEFVSHGKSSFDGKGFIACTLRLLEDICTDKKNGGTNVKRSCFLLSLRQAQKDHSISGPLYFHFWSIL